MLSEAKENYQTKSELALSTLRDAIIDGTYEPGKKLVLKELVSKFKIPMSDQPIREALKALANEGLVVILPHAGAEVACPDPSDVRVLFELRGILEAFSVVKSLSEIDDDLIRLLTEKLVLMKYYCDQEDGEQFGRLNREFHKLLHSKSNSMLQGMIVNCWKGTRSHFRRYPSPRMKASHEEHRAIVEAIKAGDAERVDVLMKEHLAHVIDSYVHVG